MLRRRCEGNITKEVITVGIDDDLDCYSMEVFLRAKHDRAEMLNSNTNMPCPLCLFSPFLLPCLLPLFA